MEWHENILVCDVQYVIKHGPILTWSKLISYITKTIYSFSINTYYH